MGTTGFITSCRNTVTVTGDIIYPPGVTLRHRNCYVTGCYGVTFEAKIGNLVLYLKKLLCRHYNRGVTPPDNVNGQGGQSVRLQNNANCNARLDMRAGKVRSESSGYANR